MTVYLPYECYYNNNIEERYLIDVYQEKEDAKKAIKEHIDSLRSTQFDPGNVETSERSSGNTFWVDEDNNVIAYLEQRVVK